MNTFMNFVKKNKRWSGSFKRGRGLGKSLIAANIRSSGGALPGKLIQLSIEIDWSIDTKAPAGGTRSWSHCKDLIMMLFFQTGWLTC